MRVYIGWIGMIGCLFLSSCAPKLGGDDYNAQSVGEVSRTSKGVIIAVRVINIEAKNPSEIGAGAVVGGATGALLGSTLGRGEGSLVTGILGAIGGGVAGHYAEQKLTEQQGVEYQIQLDQGDLITLSQGAEPHLSVGEHVLVIESSRGRSRVIRDHAVN